MPFRTTTSLRIAAVLSLTCAGCAAPPAEPPPAELAAELERELAARAEAAAARSRALDTPGAFDPWDAVLETSAPAVLAARHELAVAAARARASGVAPAMLDVEYAANGSDRQTQLMLALDLLGLLGAGRGGAERARAEVAAALAQAKLEAARFRTRHELGRAVAAVAVARELERGLATLGEEIAPARRRLELLDARDWLPPDRIAFARVALHHLDTMRTSQRASVAATRAQLQRVSGLPGDSPWLADAEATSLAVARRRAVAAEGEDDPAAATLLERHPELALARLDYLESEAELRLACAERWPAVWIGPNAMLLPDQWMLGGVLRLELPWPPSAGAAVDAARAEREAARDRLIAALAETQARIAARREQESAAAAALHEHGEPLLEQSAHALRAAQARFAVDVAALADWAMAVEQRSRALAAWSAALEQQLVAALDRSEAVGTSTRGEPEDAR